MTRRVDYALLGLLALLWGSSYLFIRVAVAEIPPLTLIVMAVNVAIAYWWGREQGVQFARRPLR